jgi:hypothetical protein
MITGFLLANTPLPEFNPDTVTPGPAGFVAIFFVAAAVVLLGFDMVRRIRRTTYRAEITARLEAELAARNAGNTATAGPPETAETAGPTRGAEAPPGDTLQG